MLQALSNCVLLLFVTFSMYIMGKHTDLLVILLAALSEAWINITVILSRLSSATCLLPFQPYQRALMQASRS